MSGRYPLPPNAVPRVADKPLSAYVRLSDLPCWWEASGVQVQAAEGTVRRIIDPAWRAFGPMVVTSWMWWQDGCRPRTGAHSDPGTLDFVPLRASVGQVARWIAASLPTSYGTIIDERDHIHVTRPGYRGKVGEALYEPTEGTYVPMTWGDEWGPIPVPGVGVDVSKWGPYAVPALMILAAVLVRSLADGREPAYALNPPGWSLDWLDEWEESGREWPGTEADPDAVEAEAWGEEVAAGPDLVGPDGGPVAYEDFPSGLTFADVAAMLDVEARNHFNATGERMFVTRHTILGRWMELKRRSYDAYLREFGL